MCTSYCNARAGRETTQLKTFHEQSNQKSPYDASNTQVVVDAAMMIAVCDILSMTYTACMHAYHLAFSTCSFIFYRLVIDSVLFSFLYDKVAHD